MEIDKLVQQLEREPVLPEGPEERFSGYGVLGVSFSTGDVLALRHFPASSVGPGYSSVWHRDSIGIWEFFTDIEPHLSCTRYFGRAVADVSVTSIQINWTDANAFEVKVDGPDLEWVVKLKNTTSTSLLNLLSNMLPQNAWKSEAVVSNMERVASNMLHAGSLTLAGKAPNGQHFIAKPNLVTLVDTSKALLRGKDLGHVAKLPQQARIGQFCIPTKGLFMLGQLYFEPFDPDNHDLVMHIHTSL